jgi:hypothetical protein
MIEKLDAFGGKAAKSIQFFVFLPATRGGGVDYSAR